MDPPIKWRSQVIPVDILTGEILDPLEIATGSYIVIKKSTTVTKQGNSYAIRTITWHSRRNDNPQQSLFND